MKDIGKIVAGIVIGVIVVGFALIVLNGVLFGLGYGQ